VYGQAGLSASQLKITFMIPLNKINSIRRKSPGKIAEYLKKHGEKPVRIWSNQWGAYWRSGRAGYAYQRDEAGTYTLADAFDATSHCGQEKGIYYDFIRG
jgi:hypothetical protein